MAASARSAAANVLRHVAHRRQGSSPAGARRYQAKGRAALRLALDAGYRRPACGFKKVAVAPASPYEGAQRPGKITPFFRAELKANEAFEIDCPEIATLTGLPIGGGNYIKGFVVIMSPSELDVVAV